MANNTLIYGYLDTKTQAADRVSEVGATAVYTAVNSAVDEYQREMDLMLELLTMRTTDFKWKYYLPGGGTLQPLDQHGNPLPVIPSGSYDVSLPLQGGGTAWGDNRKSRAKMTIAEVDRNTAMVITQDADWLARHILAALFTNTTWTFEDDDHGTLTIQPLANNDTVTYVRKGGTSATDNHYLAQANAIGNGADNIYVTIRNEINEHPSNMGAVVAQIATNLRATTEALSTFIPARDPNVRVSANSDEYIGSESPSFGDEFIGYVDGVEVWEWKRLPDNYIIAQSSGAEGPVGMREEPEEELQGLFPEFHDVDGNRHLNKFIRYAGFGVVNRVAAVVAYVGISGTYAIPSGYSAPLAI